MANQQHVRFYYHQNQFVARWHVPFHLAGKDGQPRLLSIRVVRLSTAKTTRTLSIAGTNKNSEARSILLDRTEADGLGELTDSNASIDPGQFPSRRSINFINCATRNCQEFRQISQNAAEKKQRAARVAVFVLDKAGQLARLAQSRKPFHMTEFIQCGFLLSQRIVKCSTNEVVA